ncbi:MAG: hypothetical protein VYD19_01845, partial [Myxococcota bacterium]|nr:hypothetical protein [Myxococcota bacterium]
MREPTRRRWARSQRTLFFLRSWRACLACLLFSTLLFPSRAVYGQQCPERAEEASVTRQLRAMSLDLRGQLPSAAELEEALSLGEVPESWLDEWLASAAFAEVATRRHRSLLWNNLDNLNIYNNQAQLNRFRGEPPERNFVYWRNSVATGYRGARVPCLDQAATFDRNGRPRVEEQSDGSFREGWVEVNPYWAPEQSIKVCAFDAQAALYSDDGERCASPQGMRNPDCGCGPELRWCVVQESRVRINRSLAESLDRLIEEVFAEGLPYTALFSQQRLFLDGPLTHFFLHHENGRVELRPSPVDEALLTERPFNDTEWHPVNLSQAHAGILTHPAFLLRFQTNRARASRFYTSFLCSPFQPPVGGLPAGDDESARDPDLQSRDGCKYCHALLEPAAAYWGRWTEQGIAYLDPERFPQSREDCDLCARTGQGCSNECRRHYLTTALSQQETPFLGQLRAYTFRLPEHALNVEVGPRLLALGAITDQ